MKGGRGVDRRTFLSRGAGVGSAMAIGTLAGSVEGARHEAAPRKVRVGVIGCGSVSRMYLPNLSACPFVELVSTCDKIPERAEQAAARFKVPQPLPAHRRDARRCSVRPDGDADRHAGARSAEQACRRCRQAHLEREAAGELLRGGQGPARSGPAEGGPDLGCARRGHQPPVRPDGEAAPEGAIGHVAAAHATYGHLGPGWSAFFYEKLGGSMPDLGVYNMTTLTGLLGPARAVVGAHGHHHAHPPGRQQGEDQGRGGRQHHGHARPRQQHLLAHPVRFQLLRPSRPRRLGARPAQHLDRRQGGDHGAGRLRLGPSRRRPRHAGPADPEAALHRVTRLGLAARRVASSPNASPQARSRSSPWSIRSTSSRSSRPPAPRGRSGKRVELQSTFNGPLFLEGRNP